MNVELHCHNIFSNYRSNSSRLPFDCGVSLEDQLNEALKKNVQALFVTNHNTLDGYHQILEYQKAHDRYSNIQIYPGEEITIDNKGHVLAYGLDKEISPGKTLEETLDEIKRQGAVSCAAHPFAVSNGIRKKARLCDMIESFNSNNIDKFSNMVASKFAAENGLVSIAGSDSHIASTFGRSINIVEAENNLDSILQKMLAGQFKIQAAQYATAKEIYEHAHYILSNSRAPLLEYASQYHPRAHIGAKWALNSFVRHPNNRFWRALGSFALYLTKRASKKVNMEGYDEDIFEKRSWRTLISMSFTP